MDRPLWPPHRQHRVQQVEERHPLAGAGVALHVVHHAAHDLLAGALLACFAEEGGKGRGGAGVVVVVQAVGYSDGAYEPDRAHAMLWTAYALP